MRARCFLGPGADDHLGPLLKRPADYLGVGATGKLTGVDVRLGLTDGTYTEVVGGALQQGTQVVIGTQAEKTARAQPKGGPRVGLGF